MIARKPDLSQRSVRIIIGALLSSDLSVDELRKLAKELASGNLTHTLYLALEDLAFNLGGLTPHVISAVDSDLYDIATRRRVSKSAFANIANDVIPSLFNDRAVKQLTLKRMVNEFLAVASEHQEAELVENLTGGERGDRFLKGIMRR